MTNEKAETAYYKYVNFYPLSALSIMDADGDEVAFLQGDEAADLLEEIEAIEAGNFPCGPYANAEEALHVIFSNYTPDGE